jgi:glutamine synthetase
MGHYAAGLLEVMPEFTLMWAPFVNSYKRYGEGSAAGINKTWGIDNRTVGIRVLSESDGACRLEHRAPGADSNPYLVLSAMLAGGLYGLENQLEPPELIVGNAYKIAEKEAAKIPKTLGDAIQAFSDSDIARHYFGEKFVEYYAEFKRAEWNEFCSQVTDWEKRKYLEMV